MDIHGSRYSYGYPLGEQMKRGGRREAEVHRTRTQAIMLRLNEAERAMLERLASRHALSLSETLRYLIRRTDEAAKQK